MAVPTALSAPSVTYREGRRAHASIVVPSIAAALLALLPVVYLVVRAFERGWSPVRQELFNRRTFELALRSIWLAVAVVAACAVVGTGAAWLVVRTSLPGRRVLGAMLAVPLAIPTYVAAYAWLAETGLQGFAGAFLVLTACCYPYVFLPMMAALSGLDRDQEDVARSLGLRPRQVFVRVTIPQIRPALTTASLLVATYVLSDFGAVSLMRYDTFTQAIFLSYKGSFDRTPAAVLGCLLVAITSIVVVGESRARGRALASRAGRGASRPSVPTRLRGWTAPALALVVGLLAFAVAAPLGILAKWAVEGTAEGVPWAELGRTAWATLRVSALGALVTILAAMPLGILAARHRTRAVRALENAAYVGHSLPGLVIALSLVFFGVRYATPLYQRTPLLVVAYVVLFLPLAVGAIRASVAQSPPILDDVARTLGSSPMQVVRRVVLPVAAPGVGAGTALVMLTCLKELPATLLLRPTGLDTLATQLWTETSVADYGRAAPYAIAIVVLATVPMLVLTRRTGEPT